MVKDVIVLEVPRLTLKLPLLLYGLPLILTVTLPFSISIITLPLSPHNVIVPDGIGVIHDIVAYCVSVPFIVRLLLLILALEVKTAILLTFN